MAPPSPTRPSTARQQPPTPPLEGQPSTEGTLRKRVCKACDRCRLKKSKCDGGNPCSRCKSDDAICFFGERKKSHDKIYPKGYVEMLEQQQGQLVAGLQELYKLINDGQRWPGSRLEVGSNGQPSTHDILERLGVLKQDDRRSSVITTFEEDFALIQRRLYESGALPMPRRRSLSHDSESGDGIASDNTSQRDPALDMVLDPKAFFPLTPPAPIMTSLVTSSDAAAADVDMQAAPPLPTPAEDPNDVVSVPALWGDSMEFLRRYQQPASLDNLDGPSQLNPPGSSAIGAAGAGDSVSNMAHEWNDDDEFSALFNQVVA